MEGFSKTLLGLFRFLFECHHNDVSRVFTIKHRTYRVCFECGRELDYSLERMCTVPPRAADNAYAAKKAPCIAWPAQAVTLQRSGVR